MSEKQAKGKRKDARKAAEVPERPPPLPFAPRPGARVTFCSIRLGPWRYFADGSREIVAETIDDLRAWGRHYRRELERAREEAIEAASAGAPNEVLADREGEVQAAQWALDHVLSRRYTQAGRGNRREEDRRLVLALARERGVRRDTKGRLPRGEARAIAKEMRGRHDIIVTVPSVSRWLSESLP